MNYLDKAKRHLDDEVARSMAYETVHERGEAAVGGEVLAYDEHGLVIETTDGKIIGLKVAP